MSLFPAPAKDSEPKPPATGNGGEAVKTQESNSTAEPKAKSPEAADPKPKVAEQPKSAPKVAEQPKPAPKVAEQPKSTPDVPEQPKPAPKNVETERNSKTETSPKPPVEEVSASKSSDKTPAKEEPMETEDGGDDDGEKKKAEKAEPKKESSAEAKEEKIPAKRGRKRKADIEQKEIEVETFGSRTKRTREVSEEKQEAVPEKRRGRKRAAKTEVSMREAPGSEDEDDDEEDDDKDDDDEPVKKKRGRGRPPKSGKAAAPKPVKQPRHTGPTLEIPTVEGSTVACAAGDGEVGQLGIGEQGENGKSRFVAIGDIPDKVVRCAAGGMHSLLLTEKGEIYSFGCNDDGSLGRSTENEEECFVPKLTPLPEPVAKLAAGNIHSVALTKTCKVFIWGSYRDNNGAFGIQPDGDAPLRKPTELKVPETIVDVACGSEHTLLLSNKVGRGDGIGILCPSHFFVILEASLRPSGFKSSRSSL